MITEAEFLGQNNLSIISLIFSILLSYLLGHCLAYVYKKQAFALSNHESLANIFPLLTVTVAVVIAIVKSSLALSLGLVGALSIVRFRTPIKEPEELTYLFLCIAIGLANGAEQYLAAIVCFFFASLGAFLSKYIKRKSRVIKNTMRLSIKGIFISDINKILEILRSKCKTIELNNILVDQGDKDSKTSVTFNINFSSYEKLDQILVLLNNDFPDALINTIDLNNF